jgi:hypothetical protein
MLKRRYFTDVGIPMKDAGNPVLGAPAANLLDLSMTLDALNDALDLLTDAVL